MASVNVLQAVTVTISVIIVLLGRTRYLRTDSAYVKLVVYYHKDSHGCHVSSHSLMYNI